MKMINTKHLICTAVAVATVVSFGSIAMADNIQTDGDDIDAQAAEDVTEDAAEDEVIEVVIEITEEETVTREASFAVPDNGWYEDSRGDVYYYKNGERLTFWQQIGGEYYWFDESGRMFIGVLFDDDYGSAFVFDCQGKMVHDAWQEVNGSWYYLKSNGKAVTGWQQIEGKWYYFDLEDHYMYSDDFYFIDGAFYYFGSNGAMVTGWQKSGEDWYYFDKKTGKAYTDWHQIDGVWYYFSVDSELPYAYTNGIFTINGANYGFDKKGAMITGLYNSQTINYQGHTLDVGDWFYFNPKNGKAARGWTKVDGNWYYFDPETGHTPSARRGLQRIDGLYYYFDEVTAVMFKDGWKNIQPPYYYYYYSEIPARWCYFGKDGAAYTDWQEINGKTYYFGNGNSDPYMYTGYQRINGSYYYLGDDGVKRTGWFKVDGKYWYADSLGVVFQSGWKNIGGKWYYFSNRTMVTGMRKINDHWFDFGTNGICRNYDAKYAVVYN